jgi:hypothetical protein
MTMTKAANKRSSRRRNRGDTKRTNPKRSASRTADYKKRFELAARTQRWAVTMTKVRIRQLMSRSPFPRWHFVSFVGPGGRESRGVVDLIAIRKDHKTYQGLKRGDRFQIILIQVKGGYAADPTTDDADRLREVARYHRAQCVLLASWKKGASARFFSLRAKGSLRHADWVAVPDLVQVFH